MLNRLKTYYVDFYQNESPDGKIKQSILNAFLKREFNPKANLLEDIEKYVELYRRGSNTSLAHPLVKKYE